MSKANLLKILYYNEKKGIINEKSIYRYNGMPDE